MNNDKAGTLVLYDSHNIRVPSSISSSYLVPRVHISLLVEKIKTRFPDIRYHFVSFGEKVSGAKKKYNKELKYLGFETVEKKPTIVSVDAKTKDCKTIFNYTECDLDGEIVHKIHSIGPLFRRVILISGDGDMYSSLKFIKEKYGTIITIISHKERISEKLKEFEYVTLDELIK